MQGRFCCTGPGLQDAFALISPEPSGLAQIFEPWFRRFGDTLARVLDRIATVAGIERNHLRTKNMLTAGNGSACNYVARNLLEDRRVQAVASARAATELSSIVQPQASLADEGRNEITRLKKRKSRSAWKLLEDDECRKAKALGNSSQHLLFTNQGRQLLRSIHAALPPEERQGFQHEAIADVVRLQREHTEQLAAADQGIVAVPQPMQAQQHVYAGQPSEHHFASRGENGSLVLRRASSLRLSSLPTNAITVWHADPTLADDGFEADVCDTELAAKWPVHPIVAQECRRRNNLTAAAADASFKIRNSSQLSTQYKLGDFLISFHLFQLFCLLVVCVCVCVCFIVFCFLLCSLFV